MLGEPCASCHMRCCTHFSIPITLFDMARICAKLKCQPSDFCHLAPADSVEQAPHENVFLFDGKGKLREMSLRLRKKTDGSCTFFRGISGCSIHGFHPLACRAYPFVFDERGGLKKNVHFICPRDWKKNEYDEGGVKAVLEKMELEISAHNKIVRKWNAKKSAKNKGAASEEAFFAFLQAEAANSGR